MNYGLYLSATGVLSSLHKQDVISNNLANAETIGYKADTVMTRQRAPERVENGTLIADPKWMLERLGGGHFSEPTQTVFNQGGLNISTNELDIAIQGDGFLAVRVEPGADGIRLTRDGRMTINNQSQLVMAATGHSVLDVNDQPITVTGTGPLNIDESGTVRRDSNVIAQLQLSDADHGQLRKTGSGLYRIEADGAPRTQATGSIMQGYLEGSSVNPISMLNKLIGATKMAQGNVKMMQYHDFMSGQAIGTFGRVA